MQLKAPLHLLSVSVALLLLSACSSAVRWDEPYRNEPIVVVPPQGSTSAVVGQSLSSQLSAYYQDWENVPYRYGGDSRDGIDCSAFVQQAARSVMGVSLPRTTELQQHHGALVSPTEAAAGDLVFFKTGPDTRHVGVYLGNGKFMHSSQSNGVAIARTDEGYWQARLTGFRRVLGR